MDGSARDELQKKLEAALELMREAVAHPSEGDVDDLDALVMDVQERLADAGSFIARHQHREDADFLADFSRRWFRESELMRVVLDALPSEPLLTEGAYKWHVRQKVWPPLSMPTDFDQYRDGPVGMFEVACNTQYVTFEIRVADSGEKA